MEKRTLNIAALFLSLLLLSGCLTAPKLPALTDQNRNLGVLAIPKRTVNEAGVPQGLAGYATEVHLQKKGVNTLYKSIVFDRNTGRSFKFVGDIEPGDYAVTGYATVPQDSTVAVNSSKSDIRQVYIPFSIKPGQVSVLPLQFLTVRKTVSVTRFQSFLQLVSLKDDLETWQSLMQKSKNNAEWKVAWLN